MINECKIIIAAHKPYVTPENCLYVPVQVGAYGKQSIGFQRDDEGENISPLNASFCELTGLYWAWRNTDSEYLGLVHYRRYFKGSLKFKKENGKTVKILSQEDLEKRLRAADVLLPKKRRYFIETNESQYLHAHHPEGLARTKEVIESRYPEYLPSWNKVMKKTSGHRFNMFIMKKELCDQYCEWLFDVLFRVKETLVIDEWSASEQRVFGYLSERLLDVWIDRNQIRYKELPYRFIEKQNWLKKGLNFIKRKWF